jgi:hypothetical protein
METETKEVLEALDREIRKPAWGDHHFYRYRYLGVSFLSFGSVLS